MKVLLLGHSEGYGGAQTAFRRLVSALEAWEECELATIDLGDSVWHSDKSITLGRLSWRNGGPYIKLKKLVKLVTLTLRAKAWRPNVIVSVGLNQSFAFIAWSLGSSSYRIGQDFIADRPARDPILAKALKSYSAIAVQAPSMVARFQFIISGRLPVNWLPCFPASVFPEALIVARNRSNPATRFVFFGRLAANKGLDLLIRGFATCRFDAGQTLDIWGDGPLLNELIDLIVELGLTGHVNFLGKYPEGRAGAVLIASYDVLAITSTGTEGLPLILLEAMAYGLAIVATNVGALRDAGEGLPTAQFVPPETGAISNALVRADHLLRHGMIDKELIMQHYDAFFSETVMQSRWKECLRAPRQFFNHE